MESKIILGDCLEVMRTMPDKSVDLVLTDPPYGIGRDEGFEGFEGFGGFGGFGEKIARTRYASDGWDDMRPNKDVFDEMLRVGKLVLIFGGNYFADILPQGTHWLVWRKLNTMPTFSDCELVWTNSPRKSVKEYEHLWNGLIGKEKNRFHPTQKPVELMKKILDDYAKDGDKILDPFAGSGSTLVAAHELGLQATGIEISPEYVKIAQDRLSALSEPLF